uniref:Cytochrome c oxidase subunit 3 n=1 Tax=Myzostoma seymourcollegiorum TaxID=447489 RepID=A6MVL5_MYZSE|nr:cytochrome c oxidase subunit III [Myzostoma seymourcollegiorum]
MIRQPFHLVEFSPWPLISGVSALMLTLSTTYWFHTGYGMYMFFSLLFLTYTIIQWWRDVSREATYLGHHSLNVLMGLKIGMILFITSEVLFFLAFFWAFFNSSLGPNIELGIIWPPMGIEIINPLSVPLLNTIVLLSSGASVTFAHYYMIEKNQKMTMLGLLITVILGAYFTFLQATEYLETSFSITESVYGSTFFVTTGFHGLHVLIGTTFLMVCLIRHIYNHFSLQHHFGFEAAAWYWHFVDVVWIFLFICTYWWGS